MPSSFRTLLALAFLLIVTLAAHHKPSHSSHQHILASKHQTQKQEQGQGQGQEQEQEQEQSAQEDPLQALNDPAQILQSIDTDGDGFITSQELTTYIQNLTQSLGGDPPKAEDIHDAFDVLDQDHDELIGPEEFGGLAQLILSIREGAEGAGIIHQSGSGIPPETRTADSLLEKSQGQSFRSEKWRRFSPNPDYPDGTWIFYGNWGVGNNDESWNNCLKNCPVQALNENRAFDGRNYVCVRHEVVRTWAEGYAFLQKSSGIDAGDAVGGAVLAIIRAIIYAANPVRCYYMRAFLGASQPSELVPNTKRWWYYNSNNAWCNYGNEKPIFEGKETKAMCLY